MTPPTTEITAASTTWEPGAPGVFSRNFRFGEWMSGPPTPLFESWLLTAMEERLHEVHLEEFGMRAPYPRHVLVNGWYFYSLEFLPITLRGLRRSLPTLAARLRSAPTAGIAVGRSVRPFRGSVVRARVARGPGTPVRGRRGRRGGVGRVGRARETGVDGRRPCLGGRRILRLDHRRRRIRIQDRDGARPLPSQAPRGSCQRDAHDPPCRTDGAIGAGGPRGLGTRLVATHPRRAHRATIRIGAGHA